MAGNINVYNAMVDRSLTIRRLGRQGILYEYELPYGADPNKYYDEAINVKSIKRSEQYQNGKRPGQYQPLGDRRFFNYYQIKKMGPKDWMKWLEDLQRREDERYISLVENTVKKVMGNE